MVIVFLQTSCAGGPLPALQLGKFMLLAQNLNYLLPRMTTTAPILLLYNYCANIELKACTIFSHV